jgi:hypothetical protein
LVSEGSFAFYREPYRSAFAVGREPLVEVLVVLAQGAFLFGEFGESALRLGVFAFQCLDALGDLSGFSA